MGYKCPHCRAVAVSKNSLVQHIKNTHPSVCSRMAAIHNETHFTDSILTGMLLNYLFDTANVRDEVESFSGGGGTFGGGGSSGDWGSDYWGSDSGGNDNSDD